MQLKKRRKRRIALVTKMKTNLQHHRRVQLDQVEHQTKFKQEVRSQDCRESTLAKTLKFRYFSWKNSRRDMI